MPEVDYLVINDSEVEPGAPLLSSLGVRWRDNAIAIAQGASGAPRIEGTAGVGQGAVIWDTFRLNTEISASVSSSLCYRFTKSGDVFVSNIGSFAVSTVALFGVAQSGAIRIAGDYGKPSNEGGQTAFIEIERNGTVVASNSTGATGFTSYSFDVSISRGDRIRIIARHTGGTQSAQHHFRNTRILANNFLAFSVSEE